MALDPWFQNWNPPTNLQPAYHTVDFVTNSTFSPIKNHQFPSNPVNILPFLLHMSLAKNAPYQQQYHYPEIYQEDLEITGPFRTWYQWRTLDFDFPSDYERERAIINEEFIPENNLPLGIEVYKDRLFVTIPKWKSGIPASLTVLPRVPKQKSPKLVPYPNWDYHKIGSCDSLTSVFRIKADSCGRLWVLDSGQTHVTIKPRQLCPPQILIFDLHTDNLILRYRLPQKFIKQDSLYSNIMIDIRNNECNDAYAYLTDVWRFGLVVFSLKQQHSWRITDHLFYPDPLASAYDLHGVHFEWTDGIFGLSLSPYDQQSDDRILYFHPMSSFREFHVKTSIIRNETAWENLDSAFEIFGESRGKHGQASASGMDRNGVMFFNLVSRDSVGCWDSKKLYKRQNLGIIATDAETLIFPNDLKIDNEHRQSVWVLSNRLPLYLYRSLDKNDVNFRIMSAYVDEAIRGTICDPNVGNVDNYQPYDQKPEECY